MEKDFLIGAASAGHQVEGNNTNSDIWALENMKFGGYPEKSGAACDHYNQYREDIRLMAEAGLKTGSPAASKALASLISLSQKRT